VQLGDRYITGCKLGISNIHAQNQIREKECHVSAPHWVTSACQCHVSAPHWSTSPMWVPHIWQVGPTYATWQSTSGPCQQLLHQIETSGQIWLGHISTAATWQPVNGPQQQGRCQMAAHREATSACQCHMAVSHWSTSAMWAPSLHWPDMWAPPMPRVGL
jgi:hypothetical protein